VDGEVAAKSAKKKDSFIGTFEIVSSAHRPAIIMTNMPAGVTGCVDDVAAGKAEVEWFERQSERALPRYAFEIRLSTLALSARTVV
jgi:hypothetical protein